LNITHGPTAIFYGTPGGGNGPFAPWSFLAELPTLTHLTVTHTTIEPLFELLTSPDEELNNTWLCPELTSLTLISCHQHNEGILKLVGMVDARNPAVDGQSTTGLGLGLGGSAGGVKRIRNLEVRNTISVGMDVLEWLKSRVENVVVVEPPCDK